MTTATGSADEVPFLTGMEREPPKQEDWHDVTVKTGRNLWSIHGMTHRILEALGIVQGKAQSMAERGPADYDENADERRLLMRIIKDQARNSGSGPGSVNGSSKLGWLVTLNIGATLALGAWILHTLSQNTTDIAVIKCQLNPQQCPQVNRGQ
jgi:hypothetical protein